MYEFVVDGTSEGNQKIAKADRWQESDVPRVARVMFQILSVK